MAMGIAHLCKAFQVLEKEAQHGKLIYAITWELRDDYLSRSRIGLYTMVSQEETMMCQAGL